VKEITVISGKGGTGKTSLVASLVSLAHKPVVADCDVDAATSTWCLTPRLKKHMTFQAGKVLKLCRTNAPAAANA
jgi:MinD superfamily P-loop ATPase